MAVLPTTTIASTGTVVTGTAVSASDTFSAVPNRTILRVINGNAAPTNVTLTAVANAPDGTVTTNRVVAVTNATTKEMLITQGFVAADGTVAVAFSVTPTVTAVVLTV